MIYPYIFGDFGWLADGGIKWLRKFFAHIATAVYQMQLLKIVFPCNNNIFSVIKELNE